MLAPYIPFPRDLDRSAHGRIPEAAAEQRNIRLDVPMVLLRLAFNTAIFSTPKYRLFDAMPVSFVIGVADRFFSRNFLWLILVHMFTCERMALLDGVPPQSRERSDRV